jgi:parvulin-like peptidyl-prolyl isomerase
VPLPAAKLLDYLGPTALRAALVLDAGAVSEPVRSGTGYHVLIVVAREAEWLQPLADIEADVRAEYRRRAGERACAPT